MDKKLVKDEIENDIEEEKEVGIQFKNQKNQYKK